MLINIDKWVWSAYSKKYTLQYDFLLYLIMHLYYYYIHVHVQWNLYIVDTIGVGVLISEVSTVQ